MLDNVDNMVNVFLAFFIQLIKWDIVCLYFAKLTSSTTIYQ